VAAYVDAIPRLTASKLRQTAAAINTDEAEHISVLLAALGEQPVPELLSISPVHDGYREGCGVA
jgi:hypothetical protein